MSTERIASAERSAEERAAAVSWPWLWYGFLIGPLAWSAHLLLGYLLTTNACLEKTVAFTNGAHVVSVLLFLLTIAGVVVCWRNWGRMGRTFEVGAGGLAGVSIFLAVVGLLLNLYFAVSIAVASFASFYLPACKAVGG